jgi:chromosome partitioning protein
MKTLVLANQKGGVGKSAIGTQLAYYLAKLGARVLYVDLDHQRNSSNALTRSKRVAVAPFTVNAVFSGTAEDLPEGAFVLVPGDVLSSDLDQQPTKHNEALNGFVRFLGANSEKFDFAIIDTNPNPDIRYAIGLLASNYLLSPVDLTQEAIEGIGEVLNHRKYGLNKIKATLNKDLTLIGILLNKVEATPFQKANMAQLAAAYQKLLIPVDGKPGTFAMVPKRSAIAEAQAEGLPIFAMPKTKTAARDAWAEIKPVFDTIINRMGGWNGA